MKLSNAIIALTTSCLVLRTTARADMTNYGLQRGKQVQGRHGNRGLKHKRKSRKHHKGKHKRKTHKHHKRKHKKGKHQEHASHKGKGTRYGATRGSRKKFKGTTDMGTHSKNSQKCGGAVNQGHQNCQTALWGPTHDKNLACFAYGGPNDPCSLNINNDVDYGLQKDPSSCTVGNAFYLWDEPDTQGKNYEWAARKWVAYATHWESEIKAMRKMGFKFTSPLFRSDSLSKNVDTFFKECGSHCTDQNSTAYIDIVAVNAFCGPWNMKKRKHPTKAQALQGCEDGAKYIVNELKSLKQLRGGAVPVWITNWGRLAVSTADDQEAAIGAIPSFFGKESPVERVYYFTATDYGGHTTNNFLVNSTSSGKTLGAILDDTCKNI